MAYLKILTRKSNLIGCIDYSVNAEKTVDNEVKYVLNTDKTEKMFYVDCLNCGSVETAGEEMLKTKQRFNKDGKVLCYHIIQSFLPNEATPELVHKIGMDFAKECFNDYEVVVGTHLDKKHLHNHIVVNSVSFVDGKKYRSNPKKLYELRDISDKLCKENGLSVITPKGKGKHYAEWKAEKERKPTIRGQIKNDIDSFIRQSFTYKSFLEIMKKNGYEIKYGANIKYTAVRPKGSSRFFRLDTLGEGYTENDIKERLHKQQYSGNFKINHTQNKKYKSVSLRGNFNKSRKITGIRALYWHYLYVLGKVKKRTAPKKVSHFLYEDVIKFDKYVSQNRFMAENKIKTTQDLIKMKSFFIEEIDRLAEEKLSLYKKLKKEGENYKQNEEYQKISKTIKEYRYKSRQCQNIIETEERIQKFLQETKNETQREDLKNESRKRSSRTNDKRNFEDFRNSCKADRYRS